MFQLSSGDIKKERMFLTGGQGVAGSNPVIPTNTYRAQSTLSVGPFPFGVTLGSLRSSIRQALFRLPQPNPDTLLRPARHAPVPRRRRHRLCLRAQDRRARRTILGRQRPLAGRLFPQPLPQPVRPVQEVLRAQLAEVPCGANGHIERVPRLPERVVPQHRLDRRRERAPRARAVRFVRYVGSSRIAAQTALASAVTLFGVPFRRPPVLRPLMSISFYYRGIHVLPPTPRGRRSRTSSAMNSWCP